MDNYENTDRAKYGARISVAAKEVAFGQSTIYEAAVKHQVEVRDVLDMVQTCRSIHRQIMRDIRRDHERVLQSI